MTEKASMSKSYRAAQIATFAAVYVATSYIPISMFIGASSFLSLNIVVVPVIAILLFPFDAFCAAFLGGLLAFYAIPSQAAFGPFSILLPICGALFGSLAYHRRTLGFGASAFLLCAISSYLIVNYPFPYFVVPHLLAASLVAFSRVGHRMAVRVHIPIFAFIATMSEQGMMMIFAVYLLKLPWEAFIGIMPLMIYERIIGVLGATFIVLSIKRLLPFYFNST